MEPYWVEPERIRSDLMMRSLSETVRKIRKDQLSALRCENALMRYYQSNSTQPCSPRISVREALKVVVNGTPISSQGAFMEVRNRFPEIKTSRGGCMNMLSTMTSSGEIIKVRASGERGVKYTRKI